MKKVNFLIDGSNLAYRQQYALPVEFTNNDGEPTTVVFGFIRSLMKLKKEFKNAKFKVFWDGNPQARKNLSAGNYKANRSRSEEKDGVYLQIEKLKEFIKQTNIDQYYNSNEEADDLIASFVDSVGKEDINYIYSNDRDFFQLVKNGKVVLISPLKETKIYDEDEVYSKFGVSVEYVVDFRALAGDKSDNLDGVSRVSRKKLARAIEEFGSVEQLYKSNFHGWTTSEYERLKEFEQQAYLNKKIMLLNRSIDLSGCETIGSHNHDFIKNFLINNNITSIDPSEFTEIFTGQVPRIKTGIHTTLL